MSDPFDFIFTSGWSESEKDLYSDAFADTDIFADDVAAALFNEGYFNFDLSSDEINAIRDALDDYLMDEYGIDFDNVFDWEAYREAYGEG